ncbi:hypothetical protein N7548_01170 [Acholeplasma manati]|uniref:SURF1-like protein n=1 Tax=Paracholeplasma manati TaxID=591373 RepID=A0ABT2Y4M7_9MOLU|nr:hypothetical protein [Paracholeplasma manati]MCV2231437.1 hypothetical protein [Paracholeplasma manati]
MLIKYVNRMIFAFLAAIGLLLTYNFTDSAVRKDVIREAATEALANDDINFFVPFKYFNADRLYDGIVETEDHTLHVMVYEVVLVSTSVTSDEYVFRDGIFFLMEKIEGPKWGEYYSIKVVGSNNQQQEYLGFQLLDFPIYSAMNPDTAVQFIDRSQFKNGEMILPITQIDMYLEGMDEPYISIPVNFTNERFTVMDQVVEYYETNGELPEEPFNNVSISTRVEIDSTRWVILAFAIYAFIIGGLTWFVFVRKKKTMGRKKATIGVEKDIERLGLKETKK